MSFQSAINYGLESLQNIAGTLATYQPINGFEVADILLFLTERSGLLEDGSVRTPYYEVEINRQDISSPKIGDTFSVGLDKYRITAIAEMDNDIAVCEADKVR